MINEAMTAFAREFVQNGSYLPRVAKSTCAVLLAVGAVFYPEPIADGFIEASQEVSELLMEMFQPMIDNISERAVPTVTPAP